MKTVWKFPEAVALAIAEANACLAAHGAVLPGRWLRQAELHEPLWNDKDAELYVHCLYWIQGSPRQKYVIEVGLAGPARGKTYWYAVVTRGRPADLENFPDDVPVTTTLYEFGVNGEVAKVAGVLPYPLI